LSKIKIFVDALKFVVYAGMISIPVRLNLPLGAQSTFSLAEEAKNKLLQHIRDILDKTSRRSSQQRKCYISGYI